MRYAALNQGADSLADFNGFIPFGGPNSDKLPEPEKLPLPVQRYSVEQLYALALFLYSLQPPPNPNPFNPTAGRGKLVFEREGCGTCHTPPLFTNNKLLPAPGYQVPEWYRNMFEHSGRLRRLKIGSILSGCARIMYRRDSGVTTQDPRSSWPQVTDHRV